MQQYHILIQRLLAEGADKGDRTGTGTRSLFGYSMRFNLRLGFPLLTTKKTHWKSIVHELLWFIKGDTNVKYLQDNSVKIWNEWSDENGNLGPVYGAQWRSWPDGKGGFIDQLQEVIDTLKNNPNSRRMLVCSWNVAQLPAMALPPCHCLFQFYVAAGRLSCCLFQRSADSFLGVPFNVASYALLTHMIAHCCGYEVGDFVHFIGDAHLYNNHIEQAKLLLSRKHKKQPVVALNPKVTNIDDFTFDDIQLQGYKYHPAIKAKVSV